MFLSFLAFVAGLIILVGGAEGLVRGASSLAARLRVSPLVIGLTIVSLGTSAPELTVNLISAFQGSTDLAVANVVGSNIANLFLILGVGAIIVPLTVKVSTVWKEIPLALLGVLLILVMTSDRLLDGGTTNAITRTDGIQLLTLMAVFMYYIYNMAKNDRKKDKDGLAGDIPNMSVPLSTLFTIGGLVGLVVGGKLLVSGAVNIAASAGLSEAMIGLTIVAIGTSLPELATSVVAALRKQADIAIGNAVGSNIFNVFFVLGTTSTIAPLPVSDGLRFDILVSIFATLLLFAYMFIGQKHRLTRWEGITFVTLYAGYLTYLVIRG
ncbi:sodium:proton exchanger [Candidatus Saccharibacteria bacterium]|nr:MAG: sodium:proton exchanger [Candidatus Saccharibacteria bacterium]